MLYPYCELRDGTKITHSDIIMRDGQEIVLVNFERLIEGKEDFDEARCELPSLNWLNIQGFSEEEIAVFQRMAESNSHLLYYYAKEGGVQKCLAS